MASVFKSTGFVTLSLLSLFAMSVAPATTHAFVVGRDHAFKRDIELESYASLDERSSVFGNSLITKRAASTSDAFGQKGSKQCLAWADGDNTVALESFKTDHVVGLYNWGPTPPADAAKYGYDYWTMLWGGDSAKIAAFQSATSGDPLGSLILGFNEPNEEGQSNLDPVTAAVLWQQYIEPLKSKGYKLASPAVSNRPNGQQWMQEFLAACSGCTVSYQAVHWYDIGFDSLETYLTEMHNAIGLPIMLTEFADMDANGGSQPTSEDVLTFMGQALEFFDNTDWIVAACAFGIIQGETPADALETSDHTPTALGQKFIDDDY